MALVLTALKDLPLIRQGDDLADVIVPALAASAISIEDDDILVLGQKIVSKAEGRMVNLARVVPGEAARKMAPEVDKDPRLVELMLRESRSVVRTRPGTVIVEHKLGFICANAGIDHSNVAGAGTAGEEYVLLLPEDPDAFRLLSPPEARSTVRQAPGRHDHQFPWACVACGDGRHVHRSQRSARSHR